MAWRAAGRPARARARAGEGVRRPARAPTAPPVTDEPRERPRSPTAPRRTSRRIAPRAARAQRGRALLAQPRGARRQRRSSCEFLRPRVPASRPPEFDDPDGPARVPEADGRVAGARRPDRLHASSRTRRSSPTCGSPKRSSRASRSSSPPRCRSAATRTGVLVESHMGRPTKIEGNPDHPGEPRRDRRRSRRPRCSASTIPTARRRSRTLGEIRTVERLPSTRSRRRSTRSGATQGAGLRILTETVTSPTLGRADRRRCSTTFPQAKWHQCEPVGRDNARAAARAAPSARPSRRSYHFDQADVILALDADFLGGGPGQPALRARVRRAAAA